MATPSITLIDGATGTELARAGVNVAPPLWSARALVEAPQVLQRIHESYLQAGARAITTNTFRTSARCLAKVGWGARARELTARAVEIAMAARRAVDTSALILGSVGPLEDCYSPDLAPSQAQCEEEHEAMMHQLLEAGADLLLIETIGTRREAIGAARAARRAASGQWMLSVCLDLQRGAGTLLDGEPLRALIPELSEAWGVGVNCVAAPDLAPSVRLLREQLAPQVRIGASANVSRRTRAGTWIETDAIDPRRYAGYALRWIDAGASIVGGCCGTGPATIQAIREELDRRTTASDQRELQR